MDEIAIDKFKKDIRFRGKIVHIETIPSKKAEHSKIANLNKDIENYLKDEGIKLYTHQAETYNHIKEDKNVIITTATASGKTLAFNLPILEELSGNKQATALYIYPAKALSSDQLSVLKNLEERLGIDIKPERYDGDTERNKRYSIRQNSRIILTNPYQLHHILSWHHQWKRFYSNLRYIVIDEAHYYKGIFGSNVALLIRRLKRIAKYYGSDFQFILSSATLANPLELANKLTGEEFVLVDNDTSPSGEKDFILYNPFINNKIAIEENNEKEDINNKLSITPNKTLKNNSNKATLSIHQETEHIFIYLLLKNVQTLCFTVSRKIAELIAMWAKKDMLNYRRRLAKQITAYRAGYLPGERREIEEGLKSGKYLGVTCTNALELGINIGSLDAVIISGYPGTMISTWQQAGRSGRENQKSLVILVAFENQLDQYFMNNPEFFFDKPHENAIIDLNNQNIISSQIQCAANELVLTEEELKEFNISKNTLKQLLDKELLVKNTKTKHYIYSHDDQPSFKHSLDQLSTDLFKIMNNTELLEVMEKSQVYREAHEGAVLINKGETYIVDNVNLRKNIVNVVKRSVESHTIVLKDVDISIINKIKRVKVGNFTVHFGELEVKEDFIKYKKMHFSKTLGTYFLDLPPLRFKTKGIWFTIPTEHKTILEDKFKEEDVFHGGLHGIEHGIIGLFPLHVMCDRFDIGGLSTNYHADTQEATIFIYDAYEGGIGINEKAIELFKEIIHSTYDLVKNCSCKEGCPSCIYSPKCGNENKPLHKDATIYLLNFIKEKINKESITDEVDIKEIIDIEMNNRANKIKNDKVRNLNKTNINKNKNNSIESNKNNINNSNKNNNITNKFKDKTNFKTKYEEALGLFESKEYTFARDILEDMLNEDKNNDNAWYLLGAILEIQADYMKASNFLKKALRLNPYHEDASILLEKIKNESK
ncbi:DEAD/DEAH box helicase [Methanobrevibacter filiformis]|uniref:ATP-dependent RNA helicase DbpA n=1 Tax=Methanobrevibacter filiformis TaxID=55758 RepID=A0A165YYY8_9EURY|nr:DEAD/DEAH box helicase [Methanobrevibacter filiformis]KZX10048.1 ATP-dependent RNA helicase DbpA [Methanobrevibacter filiformis]